MRAGGDFGDDAAIGPVLVILRGNPLGENHPVFTHQSGRRFVTGRFYSEDYPHPLFP
jgi:hypothetical protein